MSSSTDREQYLNSETYNMLVFCVQSDENDDRMCYLLYILLTCLLQQLHSTVVQALVGTFSTVLD